MTQARAVDFLPPEDHFPHIVEALWTRGWIVVPDFLAPAGCLPLFQRAVGLRGQYADAAVGRGGERRPNTFVRSDGIRWLDPVHPLDRDWSALMEQLRLAINRRLMLGLFEYESHYACYTAGSFYKKHLDAFRGEGNRVVSVVLYLNPEWQPGEGGEFVIYPPESGEGLKFLPKAGTLAVFLSEEFPHEVLAAGRTRFSIAGWFRLNGTRDGKLDPPK